MDATKVVCKIHHFRSKDKVETVSVGKENPWQGRKKETNRKETMGEQGRE